MTAAAPVPAPQPSAEGSPVESKQPSWIQDAYSKWTPEQRREAMSFLVEESDKDRTTYDQRLRDKDREIGRRKAWEGLTGEERKSAAQAMDLRDEWIAFFVEQGADEAEFEDIGSLVAIKRIGKNAVNKRTSKESSDKPPKTVEDRLAALEKGGPSPKPTEQQRVRINGGPVRTTTDVAGMNDAEFKKYWETSKRGGL